MTMPSGNKQEQKQRRPATNGHETGSSSRQRSYFYVMVALIAFFGVLIAAIYVLSQQETDSPTATAPVATQVPPTEPAQEVELQQQLRDWFMTVEGVNEVKSLDIDVPGDDSPLIYAELNVSPGYNNTSIPNAFVAKLNDTLNVTQYSDFVVIIDDGTQVVEYTLDLKNGVWNETLLNDLSSTG